MNLIIVESPTKARTLSRFLGKDYGVEATMGHIKDLPKSKLGVDLEKNFKPEYITVEGKENQIKTIGKKAKKASHIYIATDPDREGEAIAAHVEEVLEDAKTKDADRIVFHEITKSAVEEAIKHPRKIDKNLVEAQTGRRVLDRLVGYKLSPLLWKKVRRGLSAGRVQSVAVRLIVEREGEIDRFKPEEYWEIFCDVKKDKKFTVLLIKVADMKAEVKDKKTADRVVADLKKAVYSVKEVRKREVCKRPYPPFTTSTMTQTASRLYQWSAKRTMRVAQTLYERGLITYHRTDSTNIASLAVSKARDYISHDYGATYLPENPRFYKTKSKSAQEAHEAIRPTKIKSLDEVKMSKGRMAGDANKLYQLIWRRFIACQMADSVYNETSVDVEALWGKSSYLLRASGQVMKFDGWRRVLPSKMSDEVVEIPEVSQGDKLQLIKVDPQQKFTQPPPRFNEASLIKQLETLGIGRPSTYAPIISTIQTRQYVEKEEGKFFPTPVGRAVNEFLLKNFDSIVDYQFTAGMEGDLDAIADGKKTWRQIMADFWKPFDKKLKSVEKNAKRVKIETEKLNKKCPKCKKGELVLRIGRFGKFVSCSRFPDCDYSDKYVEKVGMKCPDCKKGDVIIKRTRTGRTFFGCSRYPDCKWASWKNPKIKEKEVQK